MSDPVVIVGAGPAGAALAWILASRDLPVVLIERQRDFEREFRGEVMMPSGLAALAQMGMGDALATVPHQTPTQLAIYFRKRLAFQSSVTPDLFRDGPPPTTVSQPHLLEHFVERAHEHPHFRFVRGGTVKGLVERAGRVVGVEMNHNGQDETIAASMVIGADGRASIVRRRGGFQVVDRHAPMDVAWCKIPWPASWAGQRVIQGYVGAGHLLIALPAPDGQLQLAWVILKGTFGDVHSRGIETWVEEMAEHVPSELAAHIRQHADQIARPFILKAATDQVTTWTAPGVLLIGDAAHTMSPVGGQGLNVALRDAVVAANQLVPVLREGGGPQALDTAAARVEGERRPEIDEIQFLAGLPPKLGLRRGPLANVARGLAARLLQLPFVQSRAGSILDRFFYGTTEVQLWV